MKTGNLKLALVFAALLCALGATARAQLPSEDAIKSAKTPEQHQAIADAYTKEAQNLQAQADAHRHMDSWYSEPGYLSNKLGFPRHCRALTQNLTAAANAATSLAKAHQAIADAAKKAK
jgi:hypothetical protein